ncbi:MAG: hypothetical protein ABSF38_20435 [Verrucomicrobiota bacterium]|jgi:hypothetical protein
MSRIGKIARLPGPIRAQINARLQDGGLGDEILAWLNSMPEVKQVLNARFRGRSITKQNLSAWCLGGYQECLLTEDILAQAALLAASTRESQTPFPRDRSQAILPPPVTRNPNQA